MRTHPTGKHLLKQAVVASGPLRRGNVTGDLFRWKKYGNREETGTPYACRWLQNQLGDSYWVTDVHNCDLFEALGFSGRTDLLIFPGHLKNNALSNEPCDAIACVELKVRKLTKEDYYQAMAEAVVMSDMRHCQSPCLLTNLTEFRWIIPTNHLLHGHILIEDVALSNGGEAREDIECAVGSVLEKLADLEKNTQTIDLGEIIEELDHFGDYRKKGDKEVDDAKRQQLEDIWSQMDETERRKYVVMKEVMHLLTPPKPDSARLDASSLSQEVWMWRL